MSKNIESSICISPLRKKRILRAAKILNVSVSDILFALIVKSRIHFNKNHAILWKAVEYQEEIPDENYIIWHVSFKPKCYEFGVSERLMFKVSVSLIYSVAIDLYLDSIIENGIDNPVVEYEINTNYDSSRYDIHYYSDRTNEYWTILWNKRIRNRKKRKRKKK